MRHVIVVVGSKAQRRQPPPEIRPGEVKDMRVTVWYASTDQEHPAWLLDDIGSFPIRMFRAGILAYRFYLLVHSTKLWSGKRPLILVHGRRAADRVAAYAGTWGGGDVVMSSESGGPPLGPVRYFLLPDGSLKLRSD